MSLVAVNARLGAQHGDVVARKVAVFVVQDAVAEDAQMYRQTAMKTTYMTWSLKT